MKKNVKKRNAPAKRATRSGPKKTTILRSKSSGDKAKLAKLCDELNKLSGELIEADLMTLINNAKILIHNREVIDSVREHNASRAVSQGSGLEVRIEEAADLSYFLIYLYGYQNFFSREEMKKLVKICHEAGSRDVAAARLYNWFKNARLDVLKDSGFDSPRDPVLGNVYDLVMKKYTVKS